MDPKPAQRPSCMPQPAAGAPTPPATTTTTTSPPPTSAQRYLRIRSQSLSSTPQHEFTDSAAILQAGVGEPSSSTHPCSSPSHGSRCLSFPRLSSPFRRTGTNMARLIRRASQSFRSSPLETAATHSAQSPPSTSSSSPAYRSNWHGDEQLSGSDREITPASSSSSPAEEKSERRGGLGRRRLTMVLGRRRKSSGSQAHSSGEEEVVSDGESGFFQDEEEAVEKPVVKKDFTVVLPPEVATHVFSFLDTHTLMQSCSLVSKRWNRLVDDPYVWQHLFQNQYGPWKHKPGNDWKKMACAYKEINGRWSSRKMDPAVSYFSGHRDNVYCVQFDERKVLTGSRDNTIRVWDIKTQECLRILGTCSLSPDHPDYQLYQRKDPHHVGFHQMSVLCLQFDSEILVTGSSDHSCIIWSLPHYIPIKRLSNHQGGVLDVAFDKDHIVTCSKDTTIAVYDRKSLNLKHKFVGHTAPVNAIAIKNDYVISASGDATVKMWSISEQKLIRTFTGHERGLACVQISDDASTIVSGGNDKMIRIWNAETGKCIRELDGHRNLVRTLQLDCKHRRIISGSYDMTVRVWNMDTGRTLLSIKRYHSASVLAAKADFRRLISASQDNKVIMHDFAVGVDGADLLD